MKRHRLATRRRTINQGGSSLIEFTVVAVLLLTVMFGELEVGRLSLTYVALANSARAGARYAIVHGGNRTGSGVDGPSGPGSTSQIVSVVRAAAFAAGIPSGQPAVTVSYGSGTNTVGSPVTVTVSYPYQPVSVLLPLSVTLGSTTQGMICY